MTKPVAYALIRWATWNTPESMKRGLIKDRLRRAQLVFRWLILNNVTGANTQESGTYQDGEAKERKAWRAWHTVNNIVKGRRIGNGAVWRWAQLKVLDRDTITVDGDLGLPVTLFQHRKTGAVFADIGVHNRTRRDDNPVEPIRPKVILEIRRYCARLRAAGIPFIVAGDFNDGHNPIPELLRASQHKVDWILTSRDVITLDARTEFEPLLSDHAVTYADLKIPVATSAPRKLPKENA